MECYNSSRSSNAIYCSAVNSGQMKGNKNVSWLHPLLFCGIPCQGMWWWSLASTAFQADWTILWRNSTGAICHYGRLDRTFHYVLRLVSHGVKQDAGPDGIVGLIQQGSSYNMEHNLTSTLKLFHFCEFQTGMWYLLTPAHLPRVLALGKLYFPCNSSDVVPLEGTARHASSKVCLEAKFINEPIQKDSHVEASALHWPLPSHLGAEWWFCQPRRPAFMSFGSSRPTILFVNFFYEPLMLCNQRRVISFLLSWNH